MSKPRFKSSVHETTAKASSNLDELSSLMVGTPLAADMQGLTTSPSKKEV